ncbi:MAG: tyrosine-type recombinase/integrase [Opitutae bacterium]|nr:tyrosine-type recombinase/integrase [Opitutae bacterium]
MDIVGTDTRNLIRDAETGIFYARIKIQQRIYVRSLETTKITTARVLLPDKLKEIRESVPTAGAKGGVLERNAKFADAAEIYRAQVQQSSRLAPSSVDAKLRPLKLVKRTWPQLLEMEIRRVTPEALETYMADFERGKWPYKPHNAKSKTVPGNSPSQINKLRACLRNVFGVAVKAHVIAQNPARELEAASVGRKLLNLPTREQFAQIVAHVRTKAGRGRICGDLIEGLAYSGMRVDESRRVCWQHLDFGRSMMTVYGTKSLTSARQIPMSDAFKTLVLGMREHRVATKGGELQPTDRVFEAKEASMSLAKASTSVGMQKMTHHDLRDLFATTCIEAGVDIPTVALWLGHNDGGVLAMKTYGHVRPAHSAEAMEKVKFA